ncbi:amidohydrolase [Acetanaerobacterium sp. MSJ-12]|uniref:M20 metallopeptidase family protein n=1 Tax=Acetanaerobacterium sp. MSJ-12 TaxID=2841535 RepID=UPI001C0EE728|nr:M20 family metallopeptidase [Acetanaerobacterium sp. MSJ-12]MBU5419492.1 amidohydrolase [Acetanaerobacterium sp. MSJ-12]
MRHPLLERAWELQDQMVADRRYLHQNPELGFELPLTAAYVKKRLTEMGYEVEDICPSGFVAMAGKKTDGKVLLVRADMDALPMAEETDEPFKSQNGAMHSCGHDIHTATLLGAAQLLKEHEDELEGRVKLCFQPAEEPIKGAVEMIEKGVLENPHVDAVFGTHTSIPMKAGAVRLLEGPILASSDIFKVTIHGEGSHGSMPETGVDPVNVAAHVVIALQSIIAREVSALQPVVLTFGSIQAGQAPNIVPSDCVLQGTLRAFDPEVRKFAKKRMEEIIHSTAATFRATAEISYESETPPTVNDPAFTREMQGYMKEVVGEDCITEGPRIMGSDDFAYFTEQRPGAMFHCGMGTREEGHLFGLHNPKALFDERSLPAVAAVYANCCIQWLKHNK